MMVKLQTFCYHVGLSGEGDIERAEIAAAADAVYDLVTEMVKVFFEKDETKKVPFVA